MDEFSRGPAWTPHTFALDAAHRPRDAVDMPPARITVFYDTHCARARATIDALLDAGVMPSELNRVPMDRLTPDARAERERALIERTNGCAFTPQVFFGAEHAGSDVEISHMARTGKLARALLRDADDEDAETPRGLERVDPREMDDPVGENGKTLYGRSKSIALERRSTEEEEEEETKKTKKTKAKKTRRGEEGYVNRYVRMMETMKRAMRYRREEASVSSKTSVVGCLCGGTKSEEPPTIPKEEIVDALAVAAMTASGGEADELNLEGHDYHALEKFVRKGVLVDRGRSRYCLPMDIDRRVLNSYRTEWRDRVTSKPVDCAAYLKKMFSVIESWHTDAKTGLVDYGAVSLDDQYGEFEEATCELRAIRLDEGELANEDARKAFLLNVYNIGVKHAYANVGIPRTTRERLAFYGGVGYVIGGDFYSLDDIEHGLLRSDSPHPINIFGCSKYFKDDRAAKFVLSRKDPRIHFALNCGANSCPPIRAYSAEKIESQLELAAQAFVNGTVVVDKAASRVTMSKLLSWYARDFGPSARDVLEFIVARLKGDSRADLESMLAGGKTPRVAYSKYDWGTDSAHARPFSFTRYVG